MNIKFDYSNMTDAVVKDGISLKRIDEQKQQIDAAARAVSEAKGKGSMEWTRLPFVRESEIDEIIKYVASIRKSADSFVVLGIGGSALGCMAAAHALLHFNHNQLRKKKRETPRLFVEDNIDPERMGALLETVNIKKTYFNFITKSGETSETLSQFLIIYEALKRVLGIKKAKERVIITTTVGKGSLYDVAVKEGFKVFDIPKGAGGRFSVFSSVGLVPLAAVGVDIKMLLKGAAEMDCACSNADIYENPALMTAFLQCEAMKNGKNINVMMPYADSLKYMADFYAQVWAESLGKALDKNGKTVNVGQTPVKALGATDQHSQIQLYTEGPFDKTVTFISVEEFRESVYIPDDRSITDFAFLKSKSLGDILNAEYKATVYALTKAGRCNLSIVLPCVCGYTVGGLLTYFMYQSAYAGELLNINAFDQPGVERGKKATYAMIGRVGYEDMLEDISQTLKGGFEINVDCKK